LTIIEEIQIKIINIVLRHKNQKCITASDVSDIPKEYLFSIYKVDSVLEDLRATLVKNLAIFLSELTQEVLSLTTLQEKQQFDKTWKELGANKALASFTAYERLYWFYNSPNVALAEAATDVSWDHAIQDIGKEHTWSLLDTSTTLIDMIEENEIVNIINPLDSTEDNAYDLLSGTYTTNSLQSRIDCQIYTIYRIMYCPENYPQEHLASLSAYIDDCIALYKL